jgi:hypothetical protein
VSDQVGPVFSQPRGFSFIQVVVGAVNAQVGIQLNIMHGFFPGSLCACLGRYVPIIHAIPGPVLRSAFRIPTLSFVSRLHKNTIYRLSFKIGRKSRAGFFSAILFPPENSKINDFQPNCIESYTIQTKK